MCVSKKRQSKTAPKQRSWGNVLSSKREQKKYLSEVEAKFEDQCIAKRNEPA